MTEFILDAASGYQSAAVRDVSRGIKASGRASALRVHIKLCDGQFMRIIRCSSSSSCDSQTNVAVSLRRDEPRSFVFFRQCQLPCPSSSMARV